MDPAKTPGAVVHSAYYAMHHAARAVLLQEDGKAAATKHGAVIGRFGNIAKSHATKSDALTRLGRFMNRVHEERIGADYDVNAVTTPEDAEACLARAQEFIEVCGDVFGFRSS